MEEKTSLIKNALNFGISLGLILTIYSIILFIFDLWLNTWLGLINFIILISGIVYATKKYRTILGGYISFKDAFLTGFITIIISGIITNIYNYLFFTVINPDAISQIIEHSVSILEKFNISDEAMEQAIEKIEEDTTIYKTIRNGLIGTITGGILIPLITAAIMKKNEDMAEF